jgi:tetratricopeptide (TPR) repeat protein
MDPVTIVQVAAAALQFADAVVRISNRIHKFSTGKFELPSELKDISARLTLLQKCLDVIPSRLGSGSEDDESGLRRELYNHITLLTERCADLEKLLIEYSPQLDSSSLQVVKKALLSLSRDGRVREIGQRLTEHIPILQLSMSLIQTQKSSAPSSTPTGQPVDNSVLDNIPRRRVEDFVKRSELMESMTKHLADPLDSTRVVILQGMGGQGKTQLALEYCRESKSIGRYVGIFWVDSSDKVTVSKSFGAIADDLAPSQVSPDEESRVRLVKSALKSWTKPWLIIFDNYDDHTLYAIAEYIPESRSGHCLITSRSPGLSRLGTVINIPGMSDDQALELLLSNYELDSESDREMAYKEGQKIVNRLGHLPLAIAQANAYLREKKDTHPISQFLISYETSMKETLDSNREVSMYLSHTYSGEQRVNARTVFTTWNLSIQLLEQTPQATLKIAFLSLLGFFSNVDISEKLFRDFHCATRGNTDVPDWIGLFLDDKGSWSAGRFGDLVTELKNLSLISTVRQSRDTQGDRYICLTIHPLVRDWIVLRLDPSTREACFQMAAKVLAYSILSHYWSFEHAFCWGFRLTSEQRNVYLDHTNIWDKNFRRADRRQPMLLKLKSGKPVTVEGTFANFYQDCSLLGMSSYLYSWIWDNADTMGDHAVAIKARVGHSITENLSMELRFSEGIARSRSNLQYWTDAKADTHIINDCNYFLVMALAVSQQSGSGPECRRLLNAMLQTDSSSLPDCTRHLYMSELCYLIEPLGNDESHALARQVLEESSAIGGFEYRRDTWPIRQWDAIAVNHPDIDTRQSVAREFTEAMKYHYGEDHYFYLGSRSKLAHKHEEKGELEEAKVILSELLTTLQRAPRRSNLLEETVFSLGRVLSRQDKHKEAIEVFERVSVNYISAPEPRYVEILRLGGWIIGTYCNLCQWQDMEAAIRLNIIITTAVSWSDPMYTDTVLDLFIVATESRIKQYFGSAGAEIYLITDAIGYLDIMLDIFKNKARETAAAGREQEQLIPSELDSVETTWPKEKIGSQYALKAIISKATCLLWISKFDEATQYLQVAMQAFETIESIDDDEIRSSLAGIISFWNWASDWNPDPTVITEGIRWVCNQARYRLHSDDSRSWLRQSLQDTNDLYIYLPYDDPYLTGWSPKIPGENETPSIPATPRVSTEKTSSPKMSRLLPTRTKHRRLVSSEVIVRLSLTLAVIGSPAARSIDIGTAKSSHM